MLGFLLKIVALSVFLSVVVKYGGRYVPIPATPAIALSIVLAPAVILAFALAWQHYVSD